MPKSQLSTCGMLYWDRPWWKLLPGIILTDMGRVNLDDPSIRNAWKAKTVMARIDDPEDVAGPVVFFCSDDSAFVTGQTLNVDDGILLSQGACGVQVARKARGKMIACESVKQCSSPVTETKNNE